MTAVDAYKLIVKESGTPYTVRICKDIGGSYIFGFGPYNVSKDDPCYMGNLFTGVDKKTGKIFPYNVVENRNAYRNGKTIRIRTGADLMVSELSQMAVID